jgi:methylene-fatty-acyl-phospholipid synthase
VLDNRRVTPWLLVVVAVLLSFERVCYVWIATRPRSFSRWCARPAVARVGEPIAVVRALFLAFKALQFAVFAGWCVAHGKGAVGLTDDGVALAAGGALMTVGQVLNVLVFYRLGRQGVFFGDRFGYTIEWCQAFPFSILAHPQYVGSVLTIWGFFLAARFPHTDWYLLPILETVYYAVGALLEGGDARPPSGRPERDGSAPEGAASPFRHRSRPVS